MKSQQPPKPKKETAVELQISAEEMKKKQAKKDEDPRITKFKNAEVNNINFICENSQTAEESSTVSA